MSKLTSEQRKKRNAALFKPMMATIIAAFLIILGVFLPFTRRNSNRPENFDEYLEQYMEYYNVDSLEPDELHWLQEHYDEKFNKTSLWSDYRVMAPDLLHILISKFNFINFIAFILFTVQYLSPAILAAVMIICALCKKTHSRNSFRRIGVSFIFEPCAHNKAPAGWNWIFPDFYCYCACGSSRNMV